MHNKIPGSIVIPGYGCKAAYLLFRKVYWAPTSLRAPGEWCPSLAIYAPRLSSIRLTSATQPSSWCTVHAPTSACALDAPVLVPAICGGCDGPGRHKMESVSMVAVGGCMPYLSPVERPGREGCNPNGLGSHTSQLC